MLADTAADATLPASALAPLVVGKVGIVALQTAGVATLEDKVAALGALGLDFVVPAPTAGDESVVAALELLFDRKRAGGRFHG